MVSGIAGAFMADGPTITQFACFINKAGPFLEFLGSLVKWFRVPK